MCSAATVFILFVTGVTVQRRGLGPPLLCDIDTCLLGVVLLSYSIDQFHMHANPKNYEMVILAHDGLEWLKLDNRCELELRKEEKG